ESLTDPHRVIRASGSCFAVPDAMAVGPRRSSGPPRGILVPIGAIGRSGQIPYGSVEIPRHRYALLQNSCSSGAPSVARQSHAFLSQDLLEERLRLVRPTSGIADPRG